MAFLPFLSGLASGAAGAYSKISEENRKTEASQNKLVSDAILNKLKTDDTLLPDEQTHLFGQVLDLNGIKGKHKDALIQASGYFRNAMNEKQRQADTEQLQKPVTPVEGTAPVTGLGDLPVMPKGGSTSSMAPPIPQFKPQTAGEIDLPGQIKKAGAIAAATNKASSDAKLDLMDQEDEYKFKKADEIQARVASGQLTQEQADQRFQVLGIKPKNTGTGAATYLPAPMQGADLKARLKAEGHPQSEIDALDDSGLYRVSLDPTKTKVAGTFKIVPNTYQGKVATGSRFIDQFPKDMMGNPTDPGSIYMPVLSRTGGQPVGIMPETLINTETVQNRFEKVRQPDGSDVLVPVTTNNQSIKTPQGTPTPAPLPSPQANAPATPAPGPTPTATPRSAVPEIPISKGNGAKVTGPGVVVGGQSMSPKEKVDYATKAELYNTSIGAIKSLLRDLPQVSDLLSAGKIGLQVDPNQHVIPAIINHGATLTPAQNRFASHWQQLADEILELRIPLGAAAGRNAEMMNIIEANKGTLTQAPDILRRMLTNALGEFKNLRSPIQEAGSKYKFNVDPERSHALDEDQTFLYKEDKDTYAIPEVKKDAFEKAHPNAKQIGTR